MPWASPQRSLSKTAHRHATSVVVGAHIAADMQPFAFLIASRRASRHMYFFLWAGAKKAKLPFVSFWHRYRAHTPCYPFLKCVHCVFGVASTIIITTPLDPCPQPTLGQTGQARCFVLSCLPQNALFSKKCGPKYNFLSLLLCWKLTTLRICMREPRREKVGGRLRCLCAALQFPSTVGW